MGSIPSIITITNVVLTRTTVQVYSIVILWSTKLYITDFSRLSRLNHFNFVLETKSKTFTTELNDYQLLYTVAEGLMKELTGDIFSIRLLGVSVSNLKKEQTMVGVQLTLDF